MNDLITFQEAATILGKNLRTIQRYIKVGTLTRHDKDGKSCVSRDEVEKKFGIKNQSPKKPAGELPKQTTKRAQEEISYEVKWIEEVQKHAETREELGVWKGRAEAYQAFAARLLGNGNIEKEIAAREIKKSPVDKSIKTYTYLIYGLVGIFFIIITIFALIVLKVI